MARRVVVTKAKSADHELLQVIVIYEEGVNKQIVKAENPFTKRHDVLYQSSNGYEFK
ncbi:MAG TPA: hypothetical protein GX497_12735 [Bacillus bacterium]|nr:hypothetical protein [Bacillus sp. (in: firmicutes)]